MNWKGFGRNRVWPKFEVLSRHLPGGTEESHEKYQSGLPVSGLRFEPGISRIQRSSVNHSNTTFGKSFSWHSKERNNARRTSMDPLTVISDLIFVLKSDAS
jgi:hypothetical protein